MGVPGITLGDEVEIAVLRQAFEDSGLSKCELARRMGWVQQLPNLSAVNRALGNVSDRPGGPKRQYTNYQRAVEMIEKMGLDPTEYGL